MTLQEFREKAFALAMELGCDAAETYYEESDGFSVNAREGEIDSYNVSRRAGLSLRVQVNGSDGYAYTEALEDPEQLVRHAMDNAVTIETLDDHPMQGKCSYETIEPRDHAFSALEEADKIRLALELERRTKSVDPRVQRMVACQVGTARAHVEIHNTRGLAAVHDDSLGYSYAVPLLSDGGEVKTGFAVRRGAEAGRIAACAKEAVRNASDKFGASPVPSGTYRILLKNEAASDLFEGFFPMFSADEAQKGCSLLAGKEGEKVCAETVSIVDDPFHPVSPRAFDGEGTPCYKKTVVEKGVLKTLLHNLKTAKKAGVESTGNASRSATSAVGVGPTMMYIEPGTALYASLVRTMKNGLVITSLEGLHAGLDTISGDFSLKAEGFLVEEGRIVRPVNQITVAGNFLQMLSDTERVGGDLKFPFGSSVASPSLLIRSLMVAGE
jgi:PmbA protein